MEFISHKMSDNTRINIYLSIYLSIITHNMWVYLDHEIDIPSITTTLLQSPGLDPEGVHIRVGFTVCHKYLGVNMNTAFSM